jgi:hypothetical protein
VHADRAHDGRKLFVVGKYCTAVAVAAEGLCGEEARRGGEPDRSDLAALVGGPEALGGVAEHPQTLALAERFDGVVVGGLAEEVDRDHADRIEAEAAGRLETRREARGIKVERVLVDVDEDRGRAGPGHHLGRRREGEGRAQDRIPGLDALGHQHEGERIGPIGAGDDVLGPAEGGEIGLELLHLGTHDIAAMIDDPKHRLVHCGADAAALGRQVDESNRIRHHAISSSLFGPRSR